VATTCATSHSEFSHSLVSSADLKSCATLEQADPIDPRCAALWEANRLRFLGKPVEGATP